MSKLRESFDSRFVMDSDNGTGPKFLFRLLDDGTSTIATPDHLCDFAASFNLIEQIAAFDAVDWPNAVIGQSRPFVQMDARRDQIIALIRDTFTPSAIATAISLFAHAANVSDK